MPALEPAHNPAPRNEATVYWTDLLSGLRDGFREMEQPASAAFKPRNCLGECKGRDEVSVRFLPRAAGRSDVPAVGT